MKVVRAVHRMDHEMQSLTRLQHDIEQGTESDIPDYSADPLEILIMHENIAHRIEQLNANNV